MDNDSGTLFVCATPIGNLGDVSFRLVETLNSVDVILAEDTRVTAKLCARYEISTSLERCDDNIIRAKTPHLIARLSTGENIAFVSDAGTPGISDPGQHLISAAIDADINIEAVPGPAAVITALTLSGLPTERFYFGGFLPRKAAEKARLLESLTDIEATLVFYESPHRALSSLYTFEQIFSGRKCVLARELTKVHEEVIRGTVEEVHEIVKARDSVKGEVVFLVGPPLPRGQEDVEAMRVVMRKRRDGLLSQGMPKREIVKVLIQEFDIPRNEAYDFVHEIV